ncbi:MAG: 4Fe-4S dicluster domain-containing protein [Elusimicrobiota bacterium]|jgi:[FeFe] hydrogenase (group B1/B3)|nr:4Fe-4S dicluster domain-containing protein [Elusimicrobiota bacterium]
MTERKFSTTVRMLKYNVLKEVAKGYFNGTLQKDILEIPKRIRPGKKAAMRCCIYKERAILGERIKLAMGGNKSNPNIMEVIDIACDECPMGGYSVTDACRGCIAHYCQGACKKGAIVYDENLKAHIDKTKCINCGLCSKVCPYSAIANYKRPCENSCIPKAISPGADGEAVIDNNKCIACGACMRQCPFGAIMDKSFMLPMFDILKNSENNDKYKVYALIAPAIAGQFTYAKLGQVLSGLKKLGFYDTVEAALGADITAYDEAKELVEKGILTSSCCPAFVRFIETKYPELKSKISHNLSPMGNIAKYIKSKEPSAKLIFIGPCTAKKMEIQKDEVKEYVDGIITFEELQAIFDGLEIDISVLPDMGDLKDASYYGRIFAKSGGLAEAVQEALKERGYNDFKLAPIACNGLQECNSALLKLSKNVLNGNFIEGMACQLGCMGGAATIHRGADNKVFIDKAAQEAGKSIEEALSKVR